MDIKGVMSDDKFEEFVKRIADVYRERIQSGTVSKINTEMFMAVADPDGEKHVISTLISDLPSDEEVFCELMKKIGYAAVEKSHSLPYAVVLVSEAWINYGEGEAVVVYGAVADGRTRRYRMIVERDEQNNFRYVEDNWGVFGDEPSNLLPVFEGVAEYISKSITGMGGADLMNKLSEVVSKAMARERGEPPDQILSRPVRVEFSKN